MSGVAARPVLLAVLRSPVGRPLDGMCELWLVDLPAVPGPSDPRPTDGESP